jgi:hypothetical protein
MRDYPINLIFLLELLKHFDRYLNARLALHFRRRSHNAPKFKA